MQYFCGTLLILICLFIICDFTKKYKDGMYVNKKSIHLLNEPKISSPKMCNFLIDNNVAPRPVLGATTLENGRKTVSQFLADTVSFNA